MTHSAWLFLSKHIRVLSTIIYTFIAIGAILAGYWLVKSIFMLPQIHGSAAAVKTKRAALMVALRDVQDVKTVAPVGGPSVGSQIIQVIESEVENDAHQSGCKVAQFSAMPTPAAYVSHFGGGAEGYDMYSVKLTLVGNLSSILTTLQSLCDGPVPFEFSSVSMTPQPDAKGSGNQVSASIEINPVTKQVASK